MEETAFNPKRRLCPDGSCVGVLGADGLCSVCQHPAGAGAEPLAESSGDTWTDDVAEVSSEYRQAVEMGGGATSGFDPSRRLCDDGSCVGVVGADGVCSTCGRKAQ